LEQTLDSRLRSRSFAEDLARAETIGRSAALAATAKEREE